MVVTCVQPSVVMRACVPLSLLLLLLSMFFVPCQAIYRTLSDEPDGMGGLDVMRGAAGVTATLKQRTWQHEHAEDWAGALEVWRHLPSFLLSAPKWRVRVADGVWCLSWCGNLCCFLLPSVKHVGFQRVRASLTCVTPRSEGI